MLEVHVDNIDYNVVVSSDPDNIRKAGRQVKLTLTLSDNDFNNLFENLHADISSREEIGARVRIAVLNFIKGK